MSDIMHLLSDAAENIGVACALAGKRRARVIVHIDQQVISEAHRTFDGIRIGVLSPPLGADSITVNTDDAEVIFSSIRRGGL